ncbi:VOC family protein [Niveispirillum sp.]|uniref:VOC family protein n=1 Tax=Niveispirillum sp. TaxID=1917217 RepID=UPI001B674621|nr:VOC family protein [Niveispirillum sp.]MBP7335938.1 VOC family protein [Niveispirillum sp.]
MTEIAEASREKVEPVLKTRFYSHATLECKDIRRTRQFFEEFLGFETVQMANVSFWARLGGDQIIVVVQGPRKAEGEMPFLNHNGLDVPTDADVDRSWELVKANAEKWGLHKITKPVVQHGTYCFYFWDLDDNAWEILSNPKGGYSWGFEMGDQEGAGHMSRKFQRPKTGADAGPDGEA